MTLIRLSATETRAARDDVEAMLERAARLVVREFVAEVRRATLAGLNLRPALVASAEPLPNEVPALGALAGRWAAGVDAGMLPAIRGAYALAWRRWSTRGLTVDSPAMAALEPYVATVRDRLVRGTHFGVTVYEDSFEAVRRSLAQATAEGWTRPQLAQRIAAELSWETDGAYWRGVQKDVDHQIDSILDPLGEPGAPAREWARLNDPRVQALRDQRNVAIRHLDAERSVWQTRASLIARTEATGAYNYAAEEALSLIHI